MASSVSAAYGSGEVGSGGGGRSYRQCHQSSSDAGAFHRVPSAHFSPVGGFMPQDWVVHSSSQWLGQVMLLYFNSTMLEYPVLAQ